MSETGEKNTHFSLSRQKFFYKTRDFSHIFLHNVQKKKHFPIYIKKRRRVSICFVFYICVKGYNFQQSILLPQFFCSFNISLLLWRDKKKILVLMQQGLGVSKAKTLGLEKRNSQQRQKKTMRGLLLFNKTTNK